MCKVRRLLPLMLLLVCLCAPALAAQRGFFAMDTYMAISAEGENAEAALEAVEARLRGLEALWSVTDEGSEIYALNHAGGEAVPVCADTEAILRFGAEMGARTGGCLDITLYPVSRLWGFTTGDYRVPAGDELAAALALVGYGQLALSPGTAQLPAGMQADLGALGKGWAGTRPSPCCVSAACPRRCSTWAATCRHWAARRMAPRGAWASSCRGTGQISACWRCATRRW